MGNATDRVIADAGIDHSVRGLGPVLVVGPSPTAIGGMSTVIAQMVRLACAPSLPLRFLALTESVRLRESVFAKLRRHLRFTVDLLRNIGSHRAKLVHLHTCSGASFVRSIVDGAVARAAGARVILHIHGAMFDEFFDGAGVLWQRHIRGALERADAVVALSKGWRERLLAIAPAARIVVIENAVEEPTLTRERDTALSDARRLGAAERTGWERRGLSPALCGASAPADGRGSPDVVTRPRSFRGEPVAPSTNMRGARPSVAEVVDASRMRTVRFVTLTRLDTWKGVEELLVAARLLRDRGLDFEWKIAGPGGSAYTGPAFSARIVDLGLERAVQYLGVVTGPSKSELFASADVYVQPSHNEGLPLALLEAMVHGLAVVATSVGATAEFVENDRHGLLVPPKDAAALTDAMETLARDPHRCERMGRCCRELGRTRFSLQRFERDLVRLYGSLADDANE